MSKIFALFISFIVFLQVNSLDVPRLNVYQDLIKFSSQVKEMLRNTDFRDPSLTEDNNPVTEIAAVIDEINVESQSLNYVDRSLRDAVTALSDVYETFLTYAADLNSFNDETIDSFIEIVTTRAPDHISEYLDVLGNDDVWEKLIQQNMQKADSDMCGAKFNQQMTMYHLYEQIMVTKLTVVILFYGAYSFQNSNSSSDSADEFDQAEEIFATISQSFMQKFKDSVLPSANREVYMCDSEAHVLDEDYVELEGLFSNVVINQYEVGRNSYCGYTCPEVKSIGVKRCSQDKYGQKMCQAHPCQGKIFDCEWIGGDVDVCEMNNSSRKRYDWVRSYGNNARYGQWSSCSDGRYYEYRYLSYGFSTCVTCFCRCSEELPDSTAIRTISLRPQMSNTDENKVVANVRFVSQDNMIHIQVAETPLLPFGQIDSNQNSWVPLGNFSYVNNKTSAYFTLNDDTDLEEGVDYVFVKFNTRALYLDQIVADPEYVVTGVKFESVRYEEEKYEDLTEALQLQIHVTPFDVTTGQLNPTEDNPSQWITAESQPNPPEIYNNERSEIVYGQKSYKYDPNVVHTTEAMPNKYLMFDGSSLLSDGGQSTIPFFDARSIDSENSLAFNGLGVVYRRAEDFAGLIALELFTIGSDLLLDPSVD